MEKINLIFRKWASLISVFAKNIIHALDGQGMPLLISLTRSTVLRE
jgi:hypothetical protein